MSQNAGGDIERGNNPEDDQTQLAPNRPSKEEPSFGDSSGRFFSKYSKAAEEEDKKMVDSWQKDADGILIFTGLFSAALASFLTVTVQDLRPSSQDTSAFYLGNIYEVLADPNATRASIPSPVAQLPPFSAPRYAVWVNSLWFLSLVMSLSCALLATSLQQWARRYIRLTQPARRSPEKRARMRAFYANGVEKMHIPWAVEGLPALLHLSLFLFFGGLAIFLFNVDEQVFTSVVCWIGFFLIVYGLITLLPLIRHDSPYYTPLSKSAWFLYGSLSYITLTVLIFIFFVFRFIIPCCGHRVLRIRGKVLARLNILSSRFHGWISSGLEKVAEETVKKQTSKIDVNILDWTINSIGDDNSLEEFFKAIPGLFNSNLVKNLQENFPSELFLAFRNALHSFMKRTFSSNSIKEPVKSRRVIICEDIASIIPYPFNVVPGSDVLDQDPVIERVRVMARWCAHSSPEISSNARIRAAQSLARMEKRDDRWIDLASDVSGLSKHDLRNSLASAGNDILLAVLIKFGSDGTLYGRRNTFAELDIRHTLPPLQHGFCALWNKLVQEGGYFSVEILRAIRYHYIFLHRGTGAAPTAFSAATNSLDPVFERSSSYPSCNIAGHHPDSTAHVLVSASHAVPQQVQEEGIAPGPPSPSDPTAPGIIGDGSQAPATTESALLAPTSLHPTDASPSGAVAVALQDVSPAAILSHTLERTTQRDKDIVPTGASSTSNSLLPVSPVPTVPPPSHVPTTHNTESPALLSTMTPSRPTSDTTTLPHLRVRGFVNTGGICSSNAVLQLLLHSPPFWDLFRELGDLKRQRGAGLETGGGATPLVDATIRFFEEFTLEKESLSRQPLQQAAKESPREDEDKNESKVVDSFKPTYMYDAMKEKRQLKSLLDGKNDDAEQFLGLYLDALDEELVGLHSTRKPSSALSVEELGEEAQLAESQTEVGKRDYTASSIESPISRIFGERSRLTVRVPSQPDTVTVEAWRPLQLNIRPDSVHTIQDALTHASQPQPVEVGQSSSNKASQQVLLEALPPILVLHLDRFVYDAATERIVKIGKPVQFTPELEIPLEILAPVFGKSTDPVHYKLHGVLYHHGEPAGNGRYTVDVPHLNADGSYGEVWLHIDDETVSTVRHEDVFRNHDNERTDEGSAYMLFYCRTAPTQPR